MRKHLFYLLMLGLSLTQAQTIPEIEWTTVIGESQFPTSRKEAYAICPTGDGGYLAGGYYDLNTLPSGETSDYTVFKISSLGDLEWEKNYGGSGNQDLLWDISNSADGGYFLGGYTNSNDGDVTGYKGRKDFWIVKIDSEGTIIWEKAVGGSHDDTFVDGISTPDGGYIAIGFTMSNSGDVVGNPNPEGSNPVGWIVKLNSEGNLEWQRPWGGFGWTELRRIYPDSDGGYIVTGMTDATGNDIPEEKWGGQDFVVIKLDASGNVVWSKLYGGTRKDEGYDIKPTADGGYIAVGFTESNNGQVSYNHTTQGTIRADVWVLKLSNEGVIEWEKTYGGDGIEHGKKIIVKEDGYIISGFNRVPNSSTIGEFEGQPRKGGQDIYVMRIDLTGELVWAKILGGSDNENIWDISVTLDGGLITAGTAYSTDGDVIGNDNGQNNAWIIKLSPECTVPELNVDTTHTICAESTVTLTANVEAELISWYDSADATEPVFTGTEFETPELTETTSYWIEASNYTCKTERIEIVITVNPLPVLTIEDIEVEICTDSEASLYATSPANVIFWYANEDDTEYLYHGNLFVTPTLSENTTYWVEAYNLSTGCKSERIEVTVIVNPVPSAPIAVNVQIAEEGQTLDDLEDEIEAEGELIWYADAALTIVLPNTTPVQDATDYWVTQTINGCESEATIIEVQFLGIGEINGSAFGYYPNPAKDNLHFKGKEVVRSVQVYDMSGKLVLDQTFNSISKINLTTLPKGTYVVKATTDKKVNIFKIVKN